MTLPDEGNNSSVPEKTEEQTGALEAFNEMVDRVLQRHRIGGKLPGDSLLEHDLLDHNAALVGECSL